MAAPRGDRYIAPATSAIPGRIFVGTAGTSQAYNRYLQANAHALGFSSYNAQKKARQSPIYKALFMQEKNAFGKAPPQKRRNQLLQGLAQSGSVKDQNIRGKTVKRFGLDVDFSDHTRGGSYDMYLRKIGRRVGNEEWLPGETP